MFKTVEIPLRGHPDKVCDQIVDALLDEFLRRDPKSRVDIQALGSHGMLMIGGTVDSRADFDCAPIIEKVYREIGYEDELEPFVNLERPSEDISRILVKGGSQGTAVVYGYATKETREYLPRAVVYGNALARRIDNLRETDENFSWLGPDGKIQLTMEGDRVVAATVVVQHKEGVDLRQVQMSLIEAAVTPILGEHDGMKLFLNSGGTFHEGGFSAHVGGSGQKILADTYGGLLPSAGAGLSGKDPWNPSRCGSYMARFAAKTLVQEGVSPNVFIQVVYSIGQQDPVLIEARTGTGKNVTDVVKEQFDFRPEAIVERLGLAEPMYRRYSVYGQFGHDETPWEAVEKKT